MIRQALSLGGRLACLPLALALACVPGDLVDGGSGGFDDHTRGRLTSRAEVLAWSSAAAGSSALKFVVTEFSAASARAMLYLDGGFYTLHDEWMWFRLLNGQRVRGVDLEPYAGSFATVADIVTWARARVVAEQELPLDLRFVGDRLYSPRFYSLALDTTPRGLGLGTLVHLPARSEPEAREEIWAFELEFQDDPSHAELSVFFSLLDDTLPEGIAGEVRWLVRSPAQEALALQMEQGALPYHERILRYDEIVVPGEVEVYSEGLVAGRLQLLRPGEPGLEDALSTDVLALGFVPDFLPAATGLLTAVPQTPLAHINVLAKNRGIPNAYLGGLSDDPNLDQLARVRAPVILLAEQQPAPRVVVQPISEQQFATWRSLSLRPALAVPPVEIASLPYTIDLATLSFDDVDEQRPIIGGKAAGFLGLMAPGTVVMPDAPLAITVRAYAEHLAPLRARLEEVLADVEFTRSARTRFLVLEGEDAFRARYTTAEDRAFVDELLASSTSSVLAEVVRDGGVKALITAKPMSQASLDAILDALFAQFGHFHVRQGLRFRSSSNVEDIEGFNGAGLYESHTGFLFPEQAGEHGKTVERAIKRAWASYWGAEAFEERRLSRIAHLSGHMAVLVHARFDDDSELSNAVFTYTLLPASHADEGVLEVNVQRGALSVTNPPPGTDSLPEVDVVRLGRGESEPVIERLAPSTEVSAGEVVLSDDKLREVFASARAVSEAWIVVENQGLLTSQRRRTLVLDFELREMAAGWPALSEGTPFGERLVIKQARTLEPGSAHIPAEVLALPFPRDVLSRARLVERTTCAASAFDVTVSEAYTDPLSEPDLGYAQEPFTAFVTLDLIAPLPALGLEEGRRLSFVHPGFLAVRHPGLSDGDAAYGLEVEIDPSRPEAASLSAIRLLPDGTWQLEKDEVAESGSITACESTPLFTTPDDFLRALLP